VEKKIVITPRGREGFPWTVAAKLAKGEHVDSFNWIRFELVTPENYKELP
jgi:ABC-type sugar transport system substrate-binding protein